MAKLFLKYQWRQIGDTSRTEGKDSNWRGALGRFFWGVTIFLTPGDGYTGTYIIGKVVYMCFVCLSVNIFHKLKNNKKREGDGDKHPPPAPAASVHQAVRSLVSVCEGL